MTSSNDFIDIGVSHIEVIQSIQNHANTVLLIKGKRTFVRVFVKPDRFPEDFSLSATLSCSLANKEIQCLSSLLVRVDQYNNGPDRRLWSNSLNFEIPSEFWDSAGLDSVSVESVSFTLRSVDSEQQQVRLRTEDADSNSLILEFHPSPSMHLKVVGLRVSHPETGATHEPGSKELDLIADCVECMFPIAGRNIHFNKVWVDACPEFELLNRGHTDAYRNDEIIEYQLSRLLCQLLAIRNEDIVAGQDPRTLYLGVMPDPLNQYGGMALEAPDDAAPHTVAVCSVEGSGELAAHELAHALGCEHPGIPDIAKHGRPLGQYNNLTKKEENDRNADGYISRNTDKENLVVGVDLRRRLSTPIILDGAKHFDLMTYRYPKWICEADYSELYDRLLKSDRQSFTADSASWSTIASYQVEDNRGAIEHVLKSRYWCPQPSDAAPHDNTYNPKTQMSLHWNGATPSQSDSVRYFTHGDATGLSQKFGLLTHTISDVPAGSAEMINRIELTVNNKVAGEYADENLSDVENPFDAIVASIKSSLAQLPRDGVIKHATVKHEVIDRKQAPKPGGKFKAGRDPDHIADLKMDDEPRLLDHGIRLTWSASTAQPYLHFYWPDTGKRLSTTVQCLYMPNGGKSPLWQTIAVTNARHQRIWIDRRFYGLAGPDDNGGRKESDLNLHERLGLGLAVRIFVGIGFERICVFHTGVTADNEPAITDNLINEEHRRTSVGTRGHFINGLLLPVVQHTQQWIEVNESADRKVPEQSSTEQSSAEQRLTKQHLMYR